ncbi:unnamed protein product [Dicrocoelium dendriticum]|nr:unnamed protein product [Dicrocoelium dendriticum]
MTNNIQNSRRADDSQQQCLEEAIATATKLQHRSVLRTFGIWWRNFSCPMLVTEWLAYGRLDIYLDNLLDGYCRTHEVTPTSDLRHGFGKETHAFLNASVIASMLLDIASGLEYLFERGLTYEVCCIHIVTSKIIP